MKPRFDPEKLWKRRRPAGSRAYRPTAKELTEGLQLSRSEVSLYLVLAGAVIMAFTEHARVLQAFMRDLPEFAIVVANLVRDAV